MPQCVDVKGDAVRLDQLALTFCFFKAGPGKHCLDKTGLGKRCLEKCA
jgi:hypothetical protein